jgi:hypothetical protein
MSLEEWVEYGWLRREPTSPGEIKDLLGIVDRSLADSKVEAVSTDLRFIAAFNAALCIATTALRASGLRTIGRPMNIARLLLLLGGHVCAYSRFSRAGRNCIVAPAAA